MNRKIVLGSSVAAAAVLATGIGIATAESGSSSHSGTNASAASSPAAPTGAVAVGTTRNLGQFLVDSQGRTLYVFQKDTGTASTCYSACAAIWPPLTASAAPHAGPGVVANQLGRTLRTDGATEVTYDGHPLYYYAADTGPGQTQGQGLNQFGGSWHVIAPSGTINNAA